MESAVVQKNSDGPCKPSVSGCETLILGKNVGGFVYCNGETGECTTDQGIVLRWVSEGKNVQVCGYFTYEWNGETVNEAWH